MSTPVNGGNAHPEDEGARPSAPITIGEAEVAANYVERELHRAKQSRNVTAGVGALLIVIALVETLVVGGKMADTLQPKHAADTASGLISERLDDRRDDLKNAIAQRLPTFIQQIPDQAIAQMPAVRENIEKTVTTDLNNYAKSSSASMNTQLTNYLSSHKDEVHSALTGGADSTAMHTLAGGLSQAFVQSLQTTSEDGETLQQKIDETQDSLSDVKAKLDRLATNKGLTPDEKRTRHIVALMARSINSTAPKLNVNQAITSAQGTVAHSL